MTRKHFRAIASILANTQKIRRTVSPDYYSAIEDIQEQLEDYFASQNPNFDRGRFNRAAHGEK